MNIIAEQHIQYPCTLAQQEPRLLDLSDLFYQIMGPVMGLFFGQSDPDPMMGAITNISLNESDPYQQGDVIPSSEWTHLEPEVLTSVSLDAGNISDRVTDKGALLSFNQDLAAQRLSMDQVIPEIVMQIKKEAWQQQDPWMSRLHLHEWDSYMIQNTPNGDSLLMKAYQDAEQLVVQHLVRMGADINYQNHKGETLLHLVAQVGDTQMVGFLLDQGARIQQDHQGKTPMFIAAQCGLDQVTEQFFEYLGQGIQGQFHRLHHLMNLGDPGVNVADHQDLFPLVAAVINGHKKIVQQWLDYGYYQNSYKLECPLYSAAKFGHQDIVRSLLVQGVPVEAARWKIPLHSAAEHGHIEIVRLLVEHGAKVNGPDMNGKQPLMLAIENGHRMVARYLLKHQAQLHDIAPFKQKVPAYLGPMHHAPFSAMTAAAYFGRSELLPMIKREMTFISANEVRHSLFLASLNGHETVPLMLKALDIKPNPGTVYGLSPLSIAAIKGHARLVRMYLEEGQRYSSGRIQGKSVLEFAVENGHLSVVQQLVDVGANINQIGFNNETTLSLAAKSGNEQVLRYLLQKGAKVGKEEAFLKASKNGHVGILNILLREGVPINTAGPNGMTGLHYAASQGHMKGVQFFINNGFNINETNMDGQTALSLAVRDGRDDIVRLLVGIGSDLGAICRGYRLDRLHVAMIFAIAVLVSYNSKHEPELGRQGQAQLSPTAITDPRQEEVYGAASRPYQRPDSLEDRHRRGPIKDAQYLTFLSEDRIDQMNAICSAITGLPMRQPVGLIMPYHRAHGTQQAADLFVEDYPAIYQYYKLRKVMSQDDLGLAHRYPVPSNPGEPCIALEDQLLKRKEIELVIQQNQDEIQQVKAAILSQALFRGRQVRKWIKLNLHYLHS
ncbi:MAG: hypothetical protein CL521_06305 [Actinobacteria bacterium]|nr:hypothetical protein [Actinomycetota bacterium]